MLAPSQLLNYGQLQQHLLITESCGKPGKLFEDSNSGHVFSYKLRYIVGFGLVEMAISTYPMRTIYRNFYENTGFEYESSMRTSS